MLLQIICPIFSRCIFCLHVLHLLYCLLPLHRAYLQASCCCWCCCKSSWQLLIGVLLLPLLLLLLPALAQLLVKLHFLLRYLSLTSYIQPCSSCSCIANTASSGIVRISC
jgi:hypothetical protein